MKSNDENTLIATDRVKNIEEYEKHFNNAISNPSVSNIALTGPYGSGKSSILKTYFLQHPEVRPLFISLAAFKAEAINDPEKLQKKKIEETAVNEQSGTESKVVSTNDDDLEKATAEKIEFSILQQLLYHVDYKQVPFSRFKRIKPVSTIRNVFFTFAICLVLAALIYNIYYSWKPFTVIINKYTTEASISQKKKTETDATEIKVETLDKIGNMDLSSYDVASISLILLGSFVILFYLLRLFRVGIIKLNLQGTEFEFTGDKELSILNEFLDEIIYFFAASNFDILIIEDLDRFKNTGIFVKLKEINTIINNSPQVKRKILFIYAIRDEVFRDETERTKFFDMVIPVVPITNAANAASYLINKFEEISPNKISHEFLEDLSVFITDRRLIKSIITEFSVYQKQLGNQSLQPNILLGLIVYKNIFPEDFSKLQRNDGVLYGFFKKRPEMIMEITAETELKRSAIIDAIETQKRLHLQSERELRSAYLCSYLLNILPRVKESYWSNRFVVQGNTYDSTQLLEEEAFNQLRNSNSINAQGTYYKETVTFNAANIDRVIDGERSYEERKEEIIRATKLKLDDFQKELTKIEHQLLNDRDLNIQQIASRQEIEKYLPENERSTVLLFLLEGGYVTEDYVYYLSNFEAGQLSQNDMEFILAVKYRRPLKWDHSLEKIGNVCKRIRIPELGKEHSLNFQLANYLIENFHENSDKSNAYIRQLSIYEPTVLQFIDQFRERNPLGFEKLVNQVIKVNKQWWQKMSNDPLRENELKFIYLQSIVSFGDTKDLLNFDNPEILRRDIGKEKRFLESKYEDKFEKFHDVFHQLQVKFCFAPDRGTESKTYAKWVYEQSAYEMNPEMINHVLVVACEIQNIDAFNKGQYTGIIASDYQPMKQYVSDNINQYIDKVYRRLPDHSTEGQIEILELLLKEDVTEANKRLLIEMTPLMFSDIDRINYQFYDDMMKYNRVEVSWNNVATYINAKIDDTTIKGITSDLLNWVVKEQNIDVLSNSNITDSDSDDLRNVLLELLTSDMIDENVKLKIADAVNFSISALELKGVELVVLQKLIPRFSYSVEVVKSFFKKDFNLFCTFVLAHWEQFKNDFDSLEIPSNGVASIYRSRLGTHDPEFIKSKLNGESVYQLLNARVVVPADVINDPKNQMTLENISKLSGKLPATSIAGIIKAHKEIIDEDVVANLLRPLGGEFAVLADRKVNKVQIGIPGMEIMVEALNDAGILIANFERKTKYIILQLN